MVKLLIIGHGRHGKDTVAEMLNEFAGLKFRSSSFHCAETLMFPLLKDKYGYANVAECFEDRHAHRAEWFDAISQYCREDKTRIGREIFASSDIYCGLRNRDEFLALKENKVFDYAIWVDRSKQLPLESIDSMNLTQDLADYVIDNNGTELELVERVVAMIHDLKISD